MKQVGKQESLMILTYQYTYYERFDWLYKGFIIKFMLWARVFTPQLHNTIKHYIN